MLIADMPDLPANTYPIVVAEAKLSARQKQRERVLGVCHPIPNLDYLPVGREHVLRPDATAGEYLWSFEESFKKLSDQEKRARIIPLEKAAVVHVLKGPVYGKLTETTPEEPKPFKNQFFYHPKPGFMGKDTLTFLVELGEYKIKLVYTIPLTQQGPGPETDERYCGKRGTEYKIS